MPLILTVALTTCADAGAAANRLSSASKIVITFLEFAIRISNTSLQAFECQNSQRKPSTNLESGRGWVPFKSFTTGIGAENSTRNDRLTKYWMPGETYSVVEPLFGTLSDPLAKAWA